MEDRRSIRRKVMPFGVLVLLLAGCISAGQSPSSRFYALQPIKDAGGAALSDAASLSNAVVGIGPVTLPDSYNRPQIVTNNADGTIEFAQFDRWAQPLHKAIAGAISQNLSLLLTHTSVETFPWHSAIPVRYQVIVKIIELDCRLDGEAVVRMQWSVLDAQEKKMLSTKRSEYRAQVTKHNYAGLVQAISVICESASKEMAQALIEGAKKG